MKVQNRNRAPARRGPQTANNRSGTHRPASSYNGRPAGSNRGRPPGGYPYSTSRKKAPSRSTYRRSKSYFFRRHWYQIVPLTLIFCILGIVLLLSYTTKISAPQTLGQEPSLPSTPSDIKKISAVFPDKIGDIPVITDLLPEDAPARPGTKREIKFIVIHETSNPDIGADAKAHNNFIHENAYSEVLLSWHYTVDDHCIYHHLPDDEIGWHASRLDANTNGIGIEICTNADGDFESAFQNAVTLTAFLINAYDLDPGQIFQHNDYYEKNCPETIRNTGRWEEFKSLVKQQAAAMQS